MRNEEAVIGVVKMRLRSTLVFPDTEPPGMVVQVVPLRYWMLNAVTGSVSSMPVKIWALPTSTGNGKSMRALLQAELALCQRLSFPTTPSVR
jgi:hypothetical protein